MKYSILSPGLEVKSQAEIMAKYSEQFYGGLSIYLVLWVFLNEMFFISLRFRDASTSLVISHLGSLGLSEGGVFLLLCVVNVSIVKFTELILWYMNLMNNGEMDRGNEHPTQHLPWWLRKTTKKHQSGRSAQGFEPRTSRMRVSSVTAESLRSVKNFSTLKYSGVGRVWIRDPWAQWQERYQCATQTGWMRCWKHGKLVKLLLLCSSLYIFSILHLSAE